ncbi:MAG TPA: nitrous oxide-stimulated promoter family protein [Verrucomicrobiae bacterium]
MAAVITDQSSAQRGRSDTPKGAERLSVGRLAREWKTIHAMVHLYCKHHHTHSPLFCADCLSLLEYAAARLERCRFGAQKPTCAKCPVHCYQRDRRDQIRAIMRFAGPRMLWEHPILSLRHWLDTLSGPPVAAHDAPS